MEKIFILDKRNKLENFNNTIKIDFDILNEESKLSYDFVCFVLSKYYNISNSIIYKDERGKPFFKDNILKFNLSHSANLIALIVSDCFDVGIDIECSTRKVSKSLEDTLETNNPLLRFNQIEALSKASGSGIKGLEALSRFNNTSLSHVVSKLIKDNDSLEYYLSYVVIDYSKEVEVIYVK